MDVKDILNSPPADDFVGIVQHDDGGLVVPSAFVGEKAKRHDGKAVALFAEVRYGAVEHDGAAAARGGDGVGLEAMAIRLVADEDFLEWRDACGLKEFLIDRHAALVVHIRVGHDRAVDFGAEKMFKHYGNLVAAGWKNQHRRSTNLAHLVHGAEELIEKDINHMALADLDIHADRRAGLQRDFFVAHLE